MPVDRFLLAVLLSGMAHSGAMAQPCPSAAGLGIVADNRTDQLAVLVTVEGRLRSAGTTCSGAGVTSYSRTTICTGAGPQECGRIEGLRPGSWIHQVRLQVPDSDEQVQTQSTTLLAAAPGVSNVVAWTVYPRTFVVDAVSGEVLLDRLDQAAAFTAASGAEALVTFDRDVFPGAADRRVIPLRFEPTDPDNDDCKEPNPICVDGRETTYCLAGSRIVVDALDASAEPGAVEVSTGKCARSLLRITGSDNVLRGLVLRGSRKINPTIAVDTVALSGSGAQRNRLEHSIVHGPTLGDAISVEGGAGAPGGAAFDNVIVDSEIAGAEDKGIKVREGGHATVASSCIHDNRNGGIQATLGGTVRALRNVVQLNRGGGAQNGLLVGVPAEVGARNVLETDGNVVRFSGARGISVVNAGTGRFAHDFVAENQVVGIRIETTLADPGATPIATLRGVTLACNHKRLTGMCLIDETTCWDDSQCMDSICVFPTASQPGTGLATGTCGGCAAPGIDLGTGGRDAGRNALAWNRGLGFSGDNLKNETNPLVQIAAAGNQWENCGTSAQCDVADVQSFDIEPPGPDTADLGTPTGPGGGPPPVIGQIVPPRPRAGTFVRVYNRSLEGIGGTFNAVDGTECSEQLAGTSGPIPGLPADPCSPESEAVVAINQQLERGNSVTVTIDGHATDVDVHAVTPTMLVFRMPTDCYAPGTLVVTRGNDAASAPVPLCDPGGCSGLAAGTPCDDGNPCTLGERCDDGGACVPSSMLACDGACQSGTCDPSAGCVPRPAGTTCSDGDSCTTGDRCDGSSPDCTAGEPAVCAGPCLTGACDPAQGCVARPGSAPCDDGSVCTVNDRCDAAGACLAGDPLPCADGNPCTADTCDPIGGCANPALPDGTVCVAVDRCRGPAACVDGSCDPGSALDCTDGDFCTDDACDPQVGCIHVDVTGVRRSTCRVEEARAILAQLPAGKLARRLEGLLDRAERALDRVDSDPRPRPAALKRARERLRRFLGAVRSARRVLGTARARELTRSGKLAIEAARAVTPVD